MRAYGEFFLLFIQFFLKFVPMDIFPGLTLFVDSRDVAEVTKIRHSNLLGSVHINKNMIK